MEEFNIEQHINEIKRLYDRVQIVWNEKKKYLDSVKKTSDYITEIQQKQQNEERKKLIGKMRNQMAKVFAEYLPALQEIDTLNFKAKQEVQKLSLSLAQDQDWEKIQLAADQASTIQLIHIQASNFS